MSSCPARHGLTSSAMKTSKLGSIRSTFQIIQGLVALLLVFLVIQGVILWRVCQHGAQATRGLEQEGIPSLTHVATFKQNLNLRLHSTSDLQEKERPAKPPNRACRRRTRNCSPTARGSRPAKVSSLSPTRKQPHHYSAPWTVRGKVTRISLPPCRCSTRKCPLRSNA